MPIPNFYEFFNTALGKNPFPYQEKMVSGPWPDVLEIPTGLGKTAAVILAWMIKRLQGDSETQRRLVYVLPMRVLVEQTFVEVRQWIDTLEKNGAIPIGRFSAYRLQGGAVDKDWDIYPEREAVIIGTQDQILSRALNRGYSMSRFRWPVHFALLNNDSMWVMDEVQLMGPGLATTAQLEAFRRHFGTVMSCRSLWMSATFNNQWLSTVDFKTTAKNLTTLSLNDDDLASENVVKRLEAEKTLLKLPLDDATDTKKIAEFILEKHIPGSRTIAVFNKVRMSQEVYTHIKRLSEKIRERPLLTLLHSRFRPIDRKENLEKLLASPENTGTICVATQAIEAGVNVSCDLLVTDLAPWASLIQRFGRCNRFGENGNAMIYWLAPDTKKKGWSAPYDENDLYRARDILNDLEGKSAAPAKLPRVTDGMREDVVLRRKDVLELFDTTNDLMGFDVDVSRFIRDSDDLSVSVFWRDLQKEGKSVPDGTQPAPEELCSAPWQDMAKFLKDKRTAYQWDPLDKAWNRAPVVLPGALLLLPVEEGGYSHDLGWTGNKTDHPTAIQCETLPYPEGDDDDPLAEELSEKTLAEHSDEVTSEVQELIRELGKNTIDTKMEQALMKAARWHDAGKAHPVFQNFLGNGGENVQTAILAKGNRISQKFGRKGFRHELASALAFLQNLPERERTTDTENLTAYIIAAHHGKLRLAIRSMPHESHPPEMDIRFARGIWEGDILPSADLGGGETLKQTFLNLSIMEFGAESSEPSWTERILELLEDPALGPYRLAFAESLLRVSDWRASMKGGKR